MVCRPLCLASVFSFVREMPSQKREKRAKRCRRTGDEARYKRKRSIDGMKMAERMARRRKSVVCLSSVCNVRAPYSAD